MVSTLKRAAGGGIAVGRAGLNGLMRADEQCDGDGDGDGDGDDSDALSRN